MPIYETKENDLGGGTLMTGGSRSDGGYYNPKIATRSNTGGRPARPDAPTPVDLGGSLMEGLSGITNPELLRGLIEATGQYLPQWQNIYNQAATNQLYGEGPTFDAERAMTGFTPEVAENLRGEYARVQKAGDTRSFNDWLQGWAQENAATGDPNAIRILNEAQSFDPNSDLGRALEGSRAISQAENEALSTARRSTMEDVATLGPQLQDIFRNANPELQAALQGANAQAQSGDFYSGLQGAIAGQPQFGDVGFNRADAPQTGPAQGYNPALAGQAQGYDAALVGDPNQVSAQQLSTGTVGRGELGQDLISQALGVGDFGATGQALQERAGEFAQSTGELSADELRQLQQSIREGYAARGTEMGSGAVTAEALGRLTNTRERMLQDLGIASSLNQQGLAESAQNRGFRQSVQGQDVGRQQENLSRQLTAGAQNQGATLSADLANQGVQQQVGLANQAAQNQAGQFGAAAQNQFSLSDQAAQNQAGQFGAASQNQADLANLGVASQYGITNQGLEAQLGLANRGFAADQAQQNIANQANLGQLLQGQQGADRSYALGLVGANQASSIDPWQALTGVSSMSPSAGMGLGANAYGASQGITGSNLFDPSIGTNLALQNQANLANYNANIYASDAAMYGAERQAAAQRSAGKKGLFGSIFGAIPGIGGLFGEGGPFG